MKRYLYTLLTLLTIGFGLTLGTHAQDDSGAAATETKLRTALRDAEVQLQAAQDQLAALQQARDASDKATKDVQAKLDALTAQAKTEKSAADADHARLTSQIVVLQHQLDDAITRNLALYNLGNDILTRYEHFGLGDALAAKEPFIGITRVKLENFVQDYQDKLTAQKVRADQPTQTTANQ